MQRRTATYVAGLNPEQRVRFEKGRAMLSLVYGTPCCSVDCVKEFCRNDIEKTYWQWEQFGSHCEAHLRWLRAELKRYEIQDGDRDANESTDVGGTNKRFRCTIEGKHYLFKSIHNRPICRCCWQRVNGNISDLALIKASEDEEEEDKEKQEEEDEESEEAEEVDDVDEEEL